MLKELATALVLGNAGQAIRPSAEKSQHIKDIQEDIADRRARRDQEMAAIRAHNRARRNSQ